MTAKDNLTYRYEGLPVDVVSLIENSGVPEFAEIDDLELFEAIKPILRAHLSYQCYGLASLSYETSSSTVEKLIDGKEYIHLTMWIKNFQDVNESSIILTIHPFGCCSINGRNIIEKTAKIEISKAVRKFLAQKLGPNYINENNEYFRMIKNKKTKQIRAEAEDKINDVNDEYAENIII